MSERRRVSPTVLTASTAVVCLVVTVLVSLLPFLSYAHEAPVLHIVLETVNSLIALLVGLLVYGRFRRSHQLNELLLVSSLSVVAVANLLLTAIPGALDRTVNSWTPLVIRLVATLLLTAAALISPRVTFRRSAGPVVLVLALVVTLLAVLALTLGENLPPPVDAADVPRNSERPRISGHPAALAVQGSSAILYALAALAFTRRAAASEDELLRWVAAGCVLAAFARVNYLLFPSLYSDFVYVGDLLRVGYYLLLLVGAVREIRTYWSAQAQAAVLEDRRRLARDLHDGLTQELSYIWSQSRHLSAHPADGAAVERINGAAARALDEARSAIAALTRTTGEGFDIVLREAGEGLASRYGATVHVDVEEGLVVRPEQGDAILRIVAEAFRNAVRHGDATRVSVDLTSDPRVPSHRRLVLM